VCFVFVIQALGDNNPYHQYTCLIVALALLFNHIAFFITKRGIRRIIMTSMAMVWVVFTLGFAFFSVVDSAKTLGAASSSQRSVQPQNAPARAGHDR
jgi:predicted PurR-regulated permease PerM